MAWGFKRMLRLGSMMTGYSSTRRPSIRFDPTLLFLMLPTRESSFPSNPRQRLGLLLMCWWHRGRH
jgi:hypothetical protein